MERPAGSTPEFSLVLRQLGEEFVQILGPLDGAGTVAAVQQDDRVRRYLQRRGG